MASAPEEPGRSSYRIFQKGRICFFRAWVGRAPRAFWQPHNTPQIPAVMGILYKVTSNSPCVCSWDLLKVTPLPSVPVLTIQHSPSTATLMTKVVAAPVSFGRMVYLLTTTHVNHDTYRSSSAVNSPRSQGCAFPCSRPQTLLQALMPQVLRRAEPLQSAGLSPHTTQCLAEPMTLGP